MKGSIRLIPLWLLPTAVFARGPIAPPLGAPSASMRTLEQIEPRTAIAGSNSHGRSLGGSGIEAVNAMNCTAYAGSTSKPGMVVTTVTNCTALGGLIGITGETLMNCSGKGINGGSAGIAVSRSATNCSGIGVAFGIDGQVGGIAKAVLTGCYGEGTTAIRCKLANGCTGTGIMTAINSYNMP